MKTEVSGGKILELMYGEGRTRDVRDARETRKGLLTLVNSLSYIQLLAPTQTENPRAKVEMDSCASA